MEENSSSSYVSFRDVVGLPRRLNNNNNRNEEDDGIINLKRTAQEAPLGGGGGGETRLLNDNNNTITTTDHKKENFVVVGNNNNNNNDNETIITTTEAMFGDVHAESLFDKQLNKFNNNSSSNNTMNNNSTTTKKDNEDVETTTQTQTTTTKTKTTNTCHPPTGTGSIDDDDDDDDGDDDDTAAAIDDDEEEEEEGNNNTYTTPNVSLLNDSLLVVGSQGDEEVLHEIPVTPIKENEKQQQQHHHQQQQQQQQSRSGITLLSPPPPPPVHDNTNMYCLEVLPEETSETQKELQIGDHVYQWRSWMGIPGVFQHHGIVMDIITDEEEEEENNNDSNENTISTNTTKINKRRRKLIIADFSNVDVPSSRRHNINNNNKDGTKKKKQHPTPPQPPRRQRSSGILSQEGIIRTYTDTDHWHKVQYEANFLKRSIYRAGTCTSVKSDSVGLVLARVHFIIQHPEALPDYHVVHANCECVAFWCKTGHWSTLQASSFLELTAAGQVKSTATLAGVAASTQVVVPATGLWGWLGYTSQVSYMSIHPFVVPALAGYACVTVGIPAIMYANARKKWKQTSQHLSDEFWGDALDNPDVFAECITHWSDKR